MKSIHDYISFDSLYYAKIQVIRLKFRTHILKSNPLSGKIVLEYQNELFRELVEGNYRIIYKVISKNQIDILTVHHTSRDLSKRNLGNT